MLALNEVAGMAQKAARGAGFPVGQAEDLGRIAAYLAGIKYYLEVSKLFISW